LDRRVLGGRFRRANSRRGHCRRTASRVICCWRERRALAHLRRGACSGVSGRVRGWVSRCGTFCCHRRRVSVGTNAFARLEFNAVQHTGEPLRGSATPASSSLIWGRGVAEWIGPITRRNLESRGAEELRSERLAPRIWVWASVTVAEVTVRNASSLAGGAVSVTRLP